MYICVIFFELFTYNVIDIFFLFSWILIVVVYFTKEVRIYIFKRFFLGFRAELNSNPDALYGNLKHIPQCSKLVQSHICVSFLLRQDPLQARFQMFKYTKKTGHISFAWSFKSDLEIPASWNFKLNHFVYTRYYGELCFTDIVL